MRQSPNIVVTGTPGAGKTTHCESLLERTGLRHVSVNQVVKDKECHEGWSDEYQSWLVDEDKVRGDIWGFEGLHGTSSRQPVNWKANILSAFGRYRGGRSGWRLSDGLACL